MQQAVPLVAIGGTQLYRNFSDCRRPPESLFRNNSNDQIKETLRAYVAFARSRNWGIAERARLYCAAEIAFGPGHNDREKRRNFEGIYDWLKASWQVFRKSTEYWTAKQTYDVLSVQCSGCSLGSGVSLMNLASEGEWDSLIACLTAMQGIKSLRSGSVSIVAVSKFLHFFNPALFPILDNDIMQGQVLKIFRESRLIVNQARLFVLPRELHEYIGFMWLAAQLVAENHEAIMRQFSSWFKTEARFESKSVELPPNLSCYYSTAFEFIAIGASEIERKGN